VRTDIGATPALIAPSPAQQCSGSCVDQTRGVADDALLCAFYTPDSLLLEVKGDDQIWSGNE